MSRQASPLLHDYKPSAAAKPAKSKAIKWFAVGLGIPLFGIALINGLGSSDPKPAPSETPVMMAVDASPLPVERTTLKLFEFPDVACSEISQLLLHEVGACRPQNDEELNCFDFMVLDSKTSATLVQ